MPQDPVTVSWVLYSLREFLGLETIRNSILLKQLRSIPGLVLGRTFSQEYSEKDLLQYLKAILSQKNKQVLFTAANLPDINTGETHYQTFVVNTSTKTLIMIDPARKSSGKGIYAPKVARDVIRPFFEANGYTVTWIDTTSACQIKLQDVFCQSWSLYLQIQTVLHPGLQITIPKAQKDKYALLLNFFKSLLTYEGFCEQLQSEYLESLNNVKNKTDKKRLEKINACAILSAMETNDMFDDDDTNSNMNNPLAVTRKPI